MPNAPERLRAISDAGCFICIFVNFELFVWFCVSVTDLLRKDGLHTSTLEQVAFCRCAQNIINKKFTTLQISAKLVLFVYINLNKCMFQKQVTESNKKLYFKVPIFLPCVFFLQKFL
jgi:hypothetical protein